MQLDSEFAHHSLFSVKCFLNAIFLSQFATFYIFTSGINTFEGIFAFFLGGGVNTFFILGGQLTRIFIGFRNSSPETRA